MNNLLSVSLASVVSVLAGYLFASWRANSKRTTDGAKSKASGSGTKNEINLKQRFKMVFAVRTDLKMGAGKMCSQCCHAAVGACLRLGKSNSALLDAWNSQGSPKIVVKCEGEDQLQSLERAAKLKGLMTYVVCDAGKTQVAPETLTALAIGPGPIADIDSVTGSLKLL